MRMISAVLAGTVTVFVWGGLSHMVLLRGVGFSVLADDDAVVTALRDAGLEDGLYAFPTPDFRGSATAEEEAEWARRYEAGPTGFLIYHPVGRSPVPVDRLLVQLACD